MLEIQNLSVYYGAVQAINNINITVQDGQVVSLLGANGAGKTTTLMSIARMINPKSGNIIYNGRSLLKYNPSEVVKQGISIAPEGRHVFPGMSVLDNLRIGSYLKKENFRDRLEKVYYLFPILKERYSQRAGTLSGGEQQMLAIGRALMADPKLLLLDEPSLGLAPVIINDIFRTINQIKATGTSILIVEQNINAAMKVSDYIYLIETGKVALEGPAHEVIKNKSIKDFYLGSSKE